MGRCLISFGANIGNPIDTIHQAVELLRVRLTRNGTPLKLSRMFRTPPVGGPSGQPPFVNAVAATEVDGSAWDAWHAIREVETLLGRQRQERWEARRIDLDILLFDGQRIWTPQFKVPHPRMCMRRFILEPALDVAAEWIDPVSGLSIAELARSLRASPASLVLVASEELRPQPLLEEVALAARCQWVQPVSQLVYAETQDHLHSLSRETSQGSNATDSVAGTRHVGHSRWIGYIDHRSLMGGQQILLLPSPKLTVLLAKPVKSSGAAWEDVHRSLAGWLGLCENDAPGFPSWPLRGPRYLLNTDDRAWALHELIAACEAMDCPIEPLA